VIKAWSQRQARHAINLEKKGSAYIVLVEISGERDHLEDLSINGRIISKYILKKLDGGLGRIFLAQNRDKWWAVLNIYL
jgi:hypothetical protein